MKYTIINNLWDNYYIYKNFGLHLRNKINHYYYSPIKSVLKKHLKYNNNLELIEIGCGNSYWLPWFSKEYSYHINGIDTSIKGCHLAEERLNNAKCSGNIVCEDFFNYYNKMTSKYDILISMGFIEHFEDTNTILKLFKKYLKENSFLITSCPNTRSIIFQIQKFINRKIYNDHIKIDLDNLIKMHNINNYNIVYYSYLQPLDFSILDMNSLGPFGFLLKILIKILNVPLNYLFYFLDHFFNLKIQNKHMSSSMIVIATNIT